MNGGMDALVSECWLRYGDCLPLVPRGMGVSMFSCACYKACDYRVHLLILALCVWYEIFILHAVVHMRMDIIETKTCALVRPKHG